MKTFHRVYATLRRKNRKNYLLLALCNFISILLITSFAIVMQSNTVQNILPQGGDSRSMMVMIFTLAIVGCVAFTMYASGLFFRSKSREMGIFMALGAKKARLSRLLYADLIWIVSLSATAGILLGTPLAVGLWKLFGLAVPNSSDMAFSIDVSGYGWPLGFLLFTTLALFWMGRRFIRRGNIMDVVNEQRKSEPVREVKRWFGPGGIGLMVAGILGAIALPYLFVSKNSSPPAWINLLYVFAAAGLYMLLLYVVVHGFGGKKSFYKNIIARSMMKFQGRATVLNMGVITLLIAAAYFALFYSPLSAAPLMRYADRPFDYAFQHRVDETNMPTQQAIEQMAAASGVTLKDYQETGVINLATDGYNRSWNDDGQLNNDYFPFWQENMFLSQSQFNAISGLSVHVEPGKYIYVVRSDYISNVFDDYEQRTLITNPDTRQTMATSLQEVLRYDMTHRFMLLNDGDYARISAGLTDEWRETWVQFNAKDVQNSYPFAARLYDTFVDASSERSLHSSSYDRVGQMQADEGGPAYYHANEPLMNPGLRHSFEFVDNWRYMPQFRVLDQMNFISTVAVFLVLFVFISIICFTAVMVIAYTRCITIASSNRQVYDDLRHLGAKREYLKRSVKGQVSKVFAIPAAIGTLASFGFFAVIMFINTGAFEKSEMVALAINGALVLVVSGLLYTVYRITLHKVSRILKVD